MAQTDGYSLHPPSPGRHYLPALLPSISVRTSFSSAHLSEETLDAEICPFCLFLCWNGTIKVPHGEKSSLRSAASLIPAPGVNTVIGVKPKVGQTLKTLMCSGDKGNKVLRQAKWL